MKASIASGIEKAIACQEGSVPSDMPCVSACGDQTSTNPSTTSRSCVSRSSAGITMPTPYSEGRRTSRTIATADDHEDGDDDVPRVAIERADAQRAGQVVRQEERRQGDHDHVVEEERPAGDEACKVVRSAPDEGRRATGLGQRRSSLGVRERDDQEEHADSEQDDRREAERVGGDDAEREVDRRGDLAVGDREERARVELARESGELAGHAAQVLRRRR